MTTCSSELVFSARSAAVVAANWASSEPSVARRIVLGKMLIGFPPCSKLSSLTPMMPADDPWRIGGGAIHLSTWNRNSANFAFWAFSEVHIHDPEYPSP